MVLDLSLCAINIHVKQHYESPRQLQELSAKVTHPAQEGTVAKLTGMVINRRPCVGQFYNVMDAESQELLDFAQKLFDNYCKLRSWLKEEPHRGTGCWGAELDNGDIIYITDIEIERSLRNQGLGSWMLRQLCGSGHVKAQDHVVCWPMPSSELRYSMTDSEYAAIFKKTISFFRKNNFRRIGLTQFFGYSPNETHPSRNILPSDDADPRDDWKQPGPVGLTMADFDPVLAAEKLKKEEERRHKYYVHAAALGPDKSRNVISTINQFYRKDPTCINVQNEFGFFPVHIAVSSGNYNAAKALITIGIKDQLYSRDNAYNMTPRELLARAVRGAKDYAAIFTLPWEGYPREALVIRMMMKQAMGEEVRMTQDEYVQQKQWGCTCGQCSCGWLSPRMRYRLKAEAKVMLRDLEPILPANKATAVIPVETIQNSVALSHIPKLFWVDLRASFAIGYKVVLQSISTLLSGDQVPNLKAVRAEIKAAPEYSTAERQAAGQFLKQGGKIDYALDCLLYSAREFAFRSKFGEGREESVSMEEDSNGGRNKTPASVWHSLPECENDLEFELLRQRFPIADDLRGPYGHGAKEMRAYADSDDEAIWEDMIENESSEEEYYEGEGYDESDDSD